MTTEEIKLWGNKNESSMTIYVPDNKTTSCAVLIFPGGAYRMLAEHEGKGYAEFFASYGILSVVVKYRVAPNKFPEPLQDAQRALQYLRYYAKKYSIDKNKIVVMGSSAGAHLAATLSTYRAFIAENGDEISKEDIIPNAQVLCYGVLALNKPYAHPGSSRNFLGEGGESLGDSLSPILIADEKTPQAFLWHTWADDSVSVINSLEYVKRLREKGVKAELHVFPDGKHGLGLAFGENKVCQYVSKWSELLLKWLQYIEFC